MTSIDLGTLTSVVGIVIIPAILGVILILGFLSERNTTSKKRLPPKPLLPVGPAQTKADEFRKMGPLRSFYFLDEHQLADMYPTITPQQLTHVEKTRTNSSQRRLRAGSQTLGAEHQKGSAEAIKELFDVSHQRAVMYNDIEKYLLDHDKITFGLESFQFDKSKIVEFETLTQQMKEKCNFPIPEDVQKSFVSKTMKDFAVENIQRLADSSGYVAITAELSTDYAERTYTLTYDHPLNQHLDATEPKAKIHITCPEDNATTTGRSVFSQTKPVRITCLGKVIRWDRDDRTLEISPIAIF